MVNQTPASYDAAEIYQKIGAVFRAVAQTVAENDKEQAFNTELLFYPKNRVDGLPLGVAVAMKDTHRELVRLVATEGPAVPGFAYSPRVTAIRELDTQGRFVGDNLVALGDDHFAPTRKEMASVYKLVGDRVGRHYHGEKTAPAPGV